ncbi:DUF368 domain-containing protein, partial [bacterium]|nr:DUF368 domain-containing protein [bacterium]
MPQQTERLSWKEIFLSTSGPKNLKETISLFVKGIAMGVANIIPGVSGGTIALITGIYQEILLAIKSLDL